MSPPSCSVGAGASAGKRKSRAPVRAKRRYSPCDPAHAQATEPATKLGPPRYRSPVWAQETGACAREKDHRVRLAARVFPVKRREPPLWEIGRASCRERVSIAVERGGGKKKSQLDGGQLS